MNPSATGSSRGGARMIERPGKCEDEPIDKPFERMRQFEDARRPQTLPPEGDEADAQAGDDTACEQKECADEKPPC